VKRARNQVRVKLVVQLACASEVAGRGMLLAAHPRRAGTAQQQHGREHGGVRGRPVLTRKECEREGFGYRLEENRRAVAKRLAAQREREHAEVDETLALAQRLIDRDRVAHAESEVAPSVQREILVSSCSPRATADPQGCESLIAFTLDAPGAGPEPGPCSSVDASCLALTDQTLARRLRELAPRRQWGPEHLNLSGNLLSLLSPSLLRLQLPTLRVLDLSRNHIGDEGAAVLLDQLRRYRQISRLNLSSNLIRGRGRDLGSMVARVSSLRALDLSDNLLGLAGIARLANALLLAEPRGELQELALARNCGSEAWPDAAAAREAAAQTEALSPVLVLVATTASLRQLDLSFNALGRPAMRALRGALLESPSPELCLCAAGNAPVGAHEPD
jgi:hypothetical protein